ncbi:MAG: hypothetical protein JWN40_3279 [Phycisphaerales bacterium]|nr:hypothetical protein [Phycisphaerales bacterium]
MHRTHKKFFSPSARLCLIALACILIPRHAQAADPADLQSAIATQTEALKTAKPADRPAIAEKLIQAYVQLSETLMNQAKFPPALDALRKAKGLTINLPPSRGAELTSQLDVRTTVALWRQANDGRGLHAEYFQGKKFDNKIGERTDARISFYWSRSAPVEGLHGDAFAVRWTGFIVAPQPGTYNIIAQYDDWCRVSIDDQDLIDDWKEGKGRADGIVKLTGKPQPIRVEFCNTGGPGHMDLHWALIGSKGEAAIPPEALFTDKAAAARLAGKPITPLKGFGLAAEYFDGDLKRSVFARTDPQVDFLWQDTRPAGVQENFSVRWKGFLKAPKPGKYHIILIHDDGARLWIDDNPLVSSWTKTASHNVQVELTGKPQPIVIELINTGGASKISLQWTPPGTDEKSTIIPFSALFTDPKTAQNAP